MSLSLTWVSIERAGHVTFTVKGPSHCGPADQVRQVAGLTVLDADFVITALCAPSFDGQGFLFDQAKVQGWAQKVCDREAYASCEHLAVDIGVRFQASLARYVPTCQVRELTVVLSPAPYKAKLTAHFGGGK